MTDVRVDQGGFSVLGGEVPPVRVDQAGISILATTGVPVRVDQAGISTLVAVTAEVKVDQAGILLLASGSPCTTQWCQVWTITRTDGEIFRFTSKDTDWTWLGDEYKACDSLNPSASEAVSEADAAGNMDLSGAIGPDGITEQELYAGLFDGAVAEAWLVPWAGEGMPHCLLKGTFGPVDQTQTGFKVELLGDGAKLMQTPLIQLITPACRWISKGGFGGPFCGVDLGPLTVTGTIDSASGLRSFTDAARGEAAGYFTRGRVTFTSGLNSGVSAEIKEHAAGGVFELWPRVTFPIAAGVTYSMTPGCTGLHEASGGTNGCAAWNNKVRFGGFKRVPGGDKRSAAANVRTS